MIRKIRHWRMMFHYCMALWHNRKFKELTIGRHCRKYTKQNGLNIKKSFVDDMHFPKAYKKQEGEE